MISDQETKEKSCDSRDQGDGAQQEEALPCREQSGPWLFINHLSIQEPQPQGSQPKILTKPRGRRNEEGGIRSRSQRASARREADLWTSWRQR